MVTLRYFLYDNQPLWERLKISYLFFCCRFDQLMTFILRMRHAADIAQRC